VKSFSVQCSSIFEVALLFGEGFHNLHVRSSSKGTLSVPSSRDRIGCLEISVRNYNSALRKITK